MSLIREVVGMVGAGETDSRFLGEIKKPVGHRPNRPKIFLEVMEIRSARPCRMALIARFLTAMYTDEYYNSRDQCFLGMDHAGAFNSIAPKSADGDSGPSQAARVVLFPTGCTNI